MPMKESYEILFFDLPRTWNLGKNSKSLLCSSTCSVIWKALSLTWRSLWVWTAWSVTEMLWEQPTSNNNNFQFGKLEKPESGIPPEFFTVCFLSISKRLKSSRRFSEVRIVSEDDPRATEFSQISPAKNRTAEDAPMVFRLICMYPEDYPVCNDLSLCRAPVIRESFAFIMRACQSRTVKMRIAN